jgi:disulfide bond formation protein DsbB
MERLLQYLDDLDDLYGMVGLINERLRRFLYALFSYSLIAAGALAGVWLALQHPPLALATCTLLSVTLLYRSVTTRSANWPQTASKNLV